METRAFINQYFDRPDAYDALRSKRKLSEETLSAIATTHEESSSAQQQLEGLRAERNRLSQQLKDAQFRSTPEGQAARLRSGEVGRAMPEIKAVLDTKSQEYTAGVFSLPNPPSDRVPVGEDETDNPVIRMSPNQRAYSFEPKGHYELLDNLGLLVDGVKVAGQGRFPVMLGEAAALEDALRIYFMRHQRANGRFEVTPPHMVSRKSLTTTGQLPKFEDELYHVYPGGKKDDLFMIPTAEVPLTNLIAGSLIDGPDLPIQLFGYSRCFRVEVGSGGRDTQGLKRVHDFGKIEMIDVVKPEDSWDALEKMTATAEEALVNLGIDYRVIALCTGDLPSGSAFTYDIETRIPDTGWREVSSCTNTLDYQARRGQIRYKDRDANKSKLVHTLNGSAFPTGRLAAAVIEQYQEKDGSIAVPEVLRPYTNFDHIKNRGSSPVSYLR